MKKLFLFSFLVMMMATQVFAQRKTVRANEEVFKGLKAAYEKSSESKMAERLIPNVEQRQIFENDVLGLFSLDIQSFNSKIGAICNCRLKEGQLKSNEVSAIKNFLSSARLNDQSKIQKHYSELISLKDASPVMSEIIKTLKQGEQPTTQAGGRGAARAVGAIIGGLLGAGIGAGVVGGGSAGIGAAAGAGVGAGIGTAAGIELGDAAYSWWTGKDGNNVMARPDGGDCTSPVLSFPLF